MDTNTPPIIPESTPEIQKSIIIASVKGHRVIIILLIVLVLALGGIIYFLLARPSTTPSTTSPTASLATVTPSFTPSPVDTSSWKTYSHETAGFSFKYPQTILLDSEGKGATQTILSVSVEKLSDLPEDLPLNMGRTEALREKTRLDKGTGENVIKIDSTYGQISSVYSQFEVCSVLFIRKLTFFTPDYRVILTLSGPKDKIITAMSNYFKIDTANCGPELVWNHDITPDFETKLINHEGVGLAQEWFDTFDQVIGTLRMTTPTTLSLGTDYQNSKYHFELSYPTTYKLLTDSDNLSGFPQGIALLYTGGQAYDIVIEVWDTEAAYKNQYAFRPSDLTVIKSGTKFVTFLDNTGSAKNKQIIATIKTIP